MNRLLLLIMSATFATAQLSAGSIATYLKEQKPLSTAGMVAATVAPAAVLGITQAMVTQTRTFLWPKLTALQLCSHTLDEIKDISSAFDRSKIAAYATRKSYGLAQGYAAGSALSIAGGALLHHFAKDKEVQKQAKKIMLSGFLSGLLGLSVSYLIGDSYRSLPERWHCAVYLESRKPTIGETRFNSKAHRIIVASHIDPNRRTIVATLMSRDGKQLLGQKEYAWALVGHPKNNAWTLFDTTSIKRND